jgi:hypothetical protein
MILQLLVLVFLTIGVSLCFEFSELIVAKPRSGNEVRDVCNSRICTSCIV